MCIYTCSPSITTDAWHACLQLIESGRDVVLAARSEEKAADVLAMLEPSGSEVTEGELRPEVFVQTGVDITDSSTLPVELLLGVAQVVSVVGPIFGRSPEGQMGYAPYIYHPCYQNLRSGDSRFQFMMCKYVKFLVCCTVMLSHA